MQITGFRIPNSNSKMRHLHYPVVLTRLRVKIGWVSFLYEYMFTTWTYPFISWFKVLLTIVGAEDKVGNCIFIKKKLSVRSYRSQDSLFKLKNATLTSVGSSVGGVGDTVGSSCCIDKRVKIGWVSYLYEYMFTTWTYPFISWLKVLLTIVGIRDGSRVGLRVGKVLRETKFILV